MTNVVVVTARGVYVNNRRVSHESLAHQHMSQTHFRSHSGTPPLYPWPTRQRYLHYIVVCTHKGWAMIQTRLF